MAACSRRSASACARCTSRSLQHLYSYDFHEFCRDNLVIGKFLPNEADGALLLLAQGVLLNRNVD